MRRKWFPTLYCLFTPFSETPPTKAYNFPRGVLARGVLETLQLTALQLLRGNPPPDCPSWVVSSRDKVFL